MPLIHEGKLPDLRVKIRAKKYWFHRSVLEKSSVIKASISAQWVEQNFVLTLECESDRDERTMLTIIDYLYDGDFYHDIPNDELIQLAEQGEYLGITSLITDLVCSVKSRLTKKNIRNHLEWSLKVVNPAPLLMCLNYLVAKGDWKKLVLGHEQKARILFEMASFSIWFPSEFDRYLFAMELWRLFGEPRLEVQWGSVVAPVFVDEKSTLIKWFQSIRYFQLSEIEFHTVILNGVLSLTDIQNIIRKRINTTDNEYCIYSEFTINNPAVNINQTSPVYDLGLINVSISLMSKDTYLGVFFKLHKKSNCTHDKCTVTVTISVPRLGSDPFGPLPKEIPLSTAHGFGYPTLFSSDKIVKSVKDTKLQLIVLIKSIKFEDVSTALPVLPT